MNKDRDDLEILVLTDWLARAPTPSPTPEHHLLNALALQELARLVLRDTLHAYRARPDGDSTNLAAMVADCTGDDGGTVALPEWVNDRLAAIEGVPPIVMQAVHRAARAL